MRRRSGRSGSAPVDCVHGSIREVNQKERIAAKVTAKRYGAHHYGARGNRTIDRVTTVSHYFESGLGNQRMPGRCYAFPYEYGRIFR